METTPKTGAAYVRVSTDGQLDYSPASQLDEIKKYAKSNNILLDSRYIFIEQEGVSGKKAENRIAFQNMIATAKTKPKPFDIILVWKFSRFARNQDEAAFYKGTLRKKYGIDILSVSEPVLEGMYGRLIETIIEWQDEFYSYNLAAEVHRGMKKKAELGGYNGKPPYGYRKKKGEVPALFEPEARTVRKIFDLFVQGCDKLSICRCLNEQHIKTQNGNPFVPDTLQYILQNPFYTGKIRWNVHKDNGRAVRDESEWIIVDGAHEPIIPEDTFMQAQKKIQDRIASVPPYSKPVSQTKHCLSGLIKCPVCGYSLTFLHRKNSGSDAFQCRGYKQGIHRESQFVTAKAVTEALLQSLQELLKECPYQYVCTKPPSDVSFEKSLILRELQKTASREQKLKQAYLDGIDTIEEYRENKEIIRQRHLELESRLAGLSGPALNGIGDNIFYVSAGNLPDFLQDDSCRSQIGTALRNILRYIEHDKETDTYTFHYYIAQ